MIVLACGSINVLQPHNLNNIVILRDGEMKTLVFIYIYLYIYIDDFQSLLR